MSADSKTIAKMNKISQEIFENTVVKDPETGLETKPFKKLKASSWEETVKKWAGIIGNIPKVPPKIISTQEEFIKTFGTPSGSSSFDKQVMTFFQGKPYKSIADNAEPMPERIFVPIMPIISNPTIKLAEKFLEGEFSISGKVVSGTKKLKATWSVEAAEDLKAVHSIDAEQELIQAMAEEMAEEIDKQIYDDLVGQLEKAKAAAVLRAEEERRTLLRRSVFGVIGRRYLEPEKVQNAESDVEVIKAERKTIVIIPALPFSTLGNRRILV